MADWSMRTMARARTFTRGWRSSGNCPMAHRGRTDCSLTCSALRERSNRRELGSAVRNLVGTGRAILFPERGQTGMKKKFALDAVSGRLLRVVMLLLAGAFLLANISSMAAQKDKKKKKDDAKSTDSSKAIVPMGDEQQ